MKLLQLLLFLSFPLIKGYVRKFPKELINKASCKTLLSDSYQNYVDLGYDEQKKEVIYSIKRGHDEKIQGAFNASDWRRCSIFSDPQNYIVCSGGNGLTVVNGDKQVHFKPSSEPDPTGFVLVQGEKRVIQWGAASAVDVEQIHFNQTEDPGVCKMNDAERNQTCPFLAPDLYESQLFDRSHPKMYGGIVDGDDFFTSQLEFWYPAVFFEGIIVLISTQSKGYGVVVDQKTTECYYLVDYKSIDEERNMLGRDDQFTQKALGPLNPAHKSVRIPIFENKKQVEMFREGLKDTIDYIALRGQKFTHYGSFHLNMMVFSVACFLSGLVMCSGLTVKSAGAYDTINAKPFHIQDIAREKFYAELMAGKNYVGNTLSKKGNTEKTSTTE